MPISGSVALANILCMCTTLVRKLRSVGCHHLREGTFIILRPSIPREMFQEYSENRIILFVSSMTWTVIALFLRGNNSGSTTSNTGALGRRRRFYVLAFSGLREKSLFTILDFAHI